MTSMSNHISRRTGVCYFHPAYGAEVVYQFQLFLDEDYIVTNTQSIGRTVENLSPQTDVMAMYSMLY